MGDQMSTEVDVVSTEVDVVRDDRVFRKALVEWTRVYMAARPPVSPPERFGADFRAALRRWSSGYCARLAAPWERETQKVPVPAVLTGMGARLVAIAP